MRPLTQLTTAPYALNVADNSISGSKIQSGAVTADKVGFDFISNIRVNGRHTPSDTRDLNLKGGTGMKLEYDSTNRSLTIGLTDYVSRLIGGQNLNLGNIKPTSTNYTWASQGDLLDPSDNPYPASATDWLGTNTTGVPLVFHAGGARVMEYFPNTTSPNILGGYSGNAITGSYGSTIAGGGSASAANSIGSKYAFLGGGRQNSITGSSDFSVLAGGENNKIDGFSEHDFLGGGLGNQILQSSDGDSAAFSVLTGGQGNTVFDRWTFVGGGQSNTAHEEHSLVVGGYLNTANAARSAIVGGSQNHIVAGSYGEVDGQESFIGAGLFNTIVDGTRTGKNVGAQSFIGAGKNNTINASTAAIVSGSLNLIAQSADGSVIGAGNGNRIFPLSGTTYAQNSFIGSGVSNTIRTSDAAIGGGNLNSIDSVAEYSFIGAGLGNTILGIKAVIGGGESNLIDTLAQYSVVSGGRANYIQGPFSGIASGDSNRIQNDSADHNFIGGGLANIEANPSFGVIGGGWKNFLDVDSWGSSIVGGVHNIVRAHHAFIGGGGDNDIERYDDFSTLGGGYLNRVWAQFDFLGGGRGNFLHGDLSTLGGGDSNTVQSVRSFLGGGSHNLMDYGSDKGVLVGGDSNVILSATYSTIVGGLSNSVAANTNYAFIGGGRLNHIDTAAVYSALTGGDSNAILPFATFDIETGYWYSAPRYDFLGGGVNDTIFNAFGTIGGGHNNLVYGRYGTIAGGDSNVIRFIPANLFGEQAEYAAIPGGRGLVAQSYAQFVAGRYNITQGTSLRTFIHPDDALAIFGNGTDDAHRSNAISISNMGYLSVYGSRGTGVATVGPPPHPARIGTTYADNTIEAWGNVAAAAITATSDLGIASISHVALSGVYIITLSTQKQDGSSFLFTAGSGAIVASLTPGPAGAAPGMISVSPITGTGSFTVTTYSPGPPAPAVSDNYGFMFHVIVR
jgi:hypothetical protein